MVCRWESIEETKLAETQIEETPEKTIVIQPEESSDIERVVVEDFNLLNVPRGLDLYTLLREFVIPRMPDGYIVKIGDAVVQPRNTSERKSFVLFLFNLYIVKLILYSKGRT